jgi:CBS domain-containing protein
MPDSLTALVDIKDEFVVVDNNATYSDVARALLDNSVKVVFVRGGKKQGLAGVIPQTHFLQVCSTGIDPKKTQAKNHMLENIIRFQTDTPLDEMLSTIEAHGPDAVLVLYEERKLAGYLSPEDYRDLKSSDTISTPTPATTPATTPVSESDDFRITIEEIEQHFRAFFGGGTAHDVVWEELGASIIVKAESIEVELTETELSLKVMIACDQAGEAVLDITIYMGQAGRLQPIIRDWAIDCNGPDTVTGRWAQRFEQSTFDGLRTLISSRLDATGLSRNGNLEGINSGHDGTSILIRRLEKETSEVQA